ncbi:MAG: DNA polymerase III subunit delta' [Gallionellaceae bacterium]
MLELYPWQVDMWQRWSSLYSRQPHALLLKGPQGTGKFEFAMKLAQSLLCEKTMFCGLACEGCASCHWFEQGSHPDFRLVQPEILSAQEEEEREGGKKPSRLISVEQIRDLSDFFNLSAHQGGYRVVLLHPAEAMNQNAANALLKSLEEPQGKFLFILVTHKPQQLLPTVRSRCLVLSATLPAVEKSLEWLQQQGVSDPMTLLSQAGFAPLQALRLANETNELGEYKRFLQEIRQPAGFDVFALAERLQKIEAAKVIHWLQQWCYDLASAKFAGTVRYHPEAAEAIRNLVAGIDPHELLRFHKELLVARREALHPLNPRLLYESMLLSYRQAMLA